MERGGEVSPAWVRVGAVCVGDACGGLLDGVAVRRVPFSYHKAVSAEEREENFFVEPGDVIVVP